MNAKYFVDDMAEDDDDEDSDGRQIDKKEDAYYAADQLKRRNKQLDIDEFEKRYQDQDEDDDEADYADGDDNIEMNYDVRMQSMLPSTRDPKLWQVRVKKNFEKVAVMALLNKCIDFAKRG